MEIGIIIQTETALSAQAIAAFDVEVQFRTLAASGNPQQALAILDRLDA